MRGKASFQLIHPPTHLREKVPDSGGPDLAAIEAEAAKRLDGLRDSFMEWAGEQLGELAGVIDSLSDLDPAKASGELLRLSHDIKGTAGSFGHELLTAIAGSLYDFIEGHQEIALRRPDILKAHMDAMTVALSGDCLGDTGAFGKELLGSLDAAVHKATRQTASTARPASEP